jgi:hypothetical protein
MFDSVAGGISGMGCEGTGCWTNYLRVQDIDGDGALDMVAPNMGGFFSLPGTAQDLEVFSNDGSGGLSSIAGSAVGGHLPFSPVKAAASFIPRIKLSSLISNPIDFN